MLFLSLGHRRCINLPGDLKKVVIFDWAGTLADEGRLDQAVCRNMEMLVAERTGRSIEWSHLRYKSLLDSLAGTWKWFSYPYHGKCLDVDWRRAQAPELHRLRLIRHARSVMSYCHSQGCKTFLATNAVSEVIALRLEWVGMTSAFDRVVTSDLVHAAKRQGRHLMYLRKHFDFSKSEVYVVGNELEQDIMPASTQGWTTILYGGSGREYHHSLQSPVMKTDVKADYTILDLNDLTSILL